MGRNTRKLIQDVTTCWNSSYYMFQRLIYEYEAVNTTLCMMDHSELCLSSHEIQTLKEAVLLLKPFEEVTKKLSSDKYVSISKVIPLVRGLQRLTVECVSTHQLKQELVANMRRRFLSIEENYILAASTL